MRPTLDRVDDELELLGLLLERSAATVPAVAAEQGAAEVKGAAALADLALVSPADKATGPAGAVLARPALEIAARSTSSAVQATST